MMRTMKINQTKLKEIMDLNSKTVTSISKETGCSVALVSWALKHASKYETIKRVVEWIGAEKVEDIV